MNSCNKSADIELVNLLKEGNELAFTSLYNKYSVQLYVNILKMVKNEKQAEEMIQILFFRVWQKRLTINYEKDFAGYLYRCAQNLVFDYYRKLERDRKLSEQFKSTISEQYSHIEEGLHYRESEKALNAALAILSPQQRNVYKLCKLDGCSYKETAHELGISIHTVKEYLSKAKETVKSYMLNEESLYI